MRVLVWILRALVFFTLFAFALNNRHDVTIHGFFGQSWQAPMVISVLAAFAAGCVIGVLAMTPAWWRHRTLRRRQSSTTGGTPPSAPSLPPSAL
jgi:lipopolysaccharide assembly protein A